MHNKNKSGLQLLVSRAIFQATVTIEELARISNKSVSVLETWSLEGGGPRFFTDGERTLYLASEIVPFIREWYGPVELGESDEWL